MQYVTFDLNTGALTGAYLQDLQPVHADCHLEVDDAVYANWWAYQLNESRDGVVPLPAPAGPHLDSIKSAAIAQTYSDVDAVILAAVGNRSEEYKEAEAAARLYLETGNDDDIDLGISSYAKFNPTGQAQSNTWAAEQIIQRADAFRDAQKLMRAERFESQAQMRAAATYDELAAAVQVWEQFIAGIRSALGL